AAAPHKHESTKKVKCVASSTDSSVSYSSRTSDKRKAKHKPDSCKTYQLIMTKLDDLGRVFATRRAIAGQPLSPAGPLYPTYPKHLTPRPLYVSSGSVSVCDKLVSTEPVKYAADKQVTLTSKSVVVSPSRLAIARTNQLDIMPEHPRRNNIVVESVVESGAFVSQPAGDHDDEQSTAKGCDRPGGRTPSLCAICRSYWRAVCRLLPSYFTKQC
ncbi:unnamed protein product, partial [Leptidea sinapis]